MYLDDVSQSVMRELARIHKRKIAPLKKALESAIVRAAKKDCWYDPWNRKGVRADYGVLYEPVIAFVKDADVEDILPMVDFLLEKAKRQIEHSNDEGDCAGQVRYWAQKLVKAAVKKNDHHIELIDWALGVVPKDIYFLTDAEELVLEKNKTATPEVWEKIAEHYKKSNRRVYLLALKKAGRIEERQKTLRTEAKRKKDYAYLIEDALSHEACAEAREIYKCALGDAEVDKAKVEVLKCGFANLDVAQGRYEREFELRWGDFVRNQTLSSYVSLKEVAMAMGKTEQVRADAIRKLELAGKWRLLSQIALRECRLADAAKYYLKNSEKSIGRRWGYEPYKFDLELSDRLSRVYPHEAVKVLRHLVDESICEDMPDYECARHALSLLKQCLFVLGKASEWTSLLESLRLQYPKKRNLMAILDELA